MFYKKIIYMWTIWKKEENTNISYIDEKCPIWKQMIFHKQKKKKNRETVRNPRFLINIWQNRERCAGKSSKMMEIGGGRAWEKRHLCSSTQNARLFCLSRTVAIVIILFPSQWPVGVAERFMLTKKTSLDRAIWIFTRCTNIIFFMFISSPLFLKF